MAQSSMEQSGQSTTSQSCLTASHCATQSAYPQSHVYRPQISESQLDHEIEVTLRIIEQKYSFQEEIEAEAEELFCICRKAEDEVDGEMIECGNEARCLYQWFHTKCIGMKEVPAEDEEWFCQRCVDRQMSKAIGHLRKPTSSPHHSLGPSLDGSRAQEPSSASLHQVVQASNWMVPETVESFANAANSGSAPEDPLHSLDINASNASPAPPASSMPVLFSRLQFVNYDDGTAAQLESSPMSISDPDPGPETKHPSCSPPKTKTKPSLRTLAPACRLDRTTSTPIGKTCTRYPWTPKEEACLTSLMKEIIKTEHNKTEVRWVVISQQMALHGYSRSPLGIKMIWGRGLREKTGIDERVCKRTTKMTVGVHWGRMRKGGGPIREGIRRDERRGWTL